jgi:hypothetical protein
VAFDGSLSLLNAAYLTCVLHDAIFSAEVLLEHDAGSARLRQHLSAASSQIVLKSNLKELSLSLLVLLLYARRMLQCLRSSLALFELEVFVNPKLVEQSATPEDGDQSLPTPYGVGPMGSSNGHATEKAGRGLCSAATLTNLMDCEDHVAEYNPRPEQPRAENGSAAHNPRTGAATPEATYVRDWFLGLDLPNVAWITWMESTATPDRPYLLRIGACLMDGTRGAKVLHDLFMNYGTTSPKDEVANAPSQFIYESYDDIPMLAQLDRRSRAFTMQHLKEDDRTKHHPVIVAACVVHEGPFAIAIPFLRGFGTPMLRPSPRLTSLFDLDEVFVEFKQRRAFHERGRDVSGTFHRPRHLGPLSARGDPRQLSQHGPR